MTRPSRRLQPVAGADLDALVPALRAAVDGTGPAVAPVPRASGAVVAAVTAAVRPDLPLESDDVAVVVTTSGSTGEPKGVLLPASALRASAAATETRLGGPAQWLLALDPGHVAGLQVVLRSLLAGTEPVQLDPDAPFDPEAFARAAAELDPGVRHCTSLVPTQLRRVVEAKGPALDALTAFDAVLVGGAATPAPLLEQAKAAGVRVVTTYGMSETCGGCVYDGRALDGVDARLQPDGRVVLAGAVVAAGYRLRPDLTAEAFPGGAFRTSDLGALDADGTLRVLGRVDDVVVTGGANVALPAVEAVALRDPRVREAAAFGRPDPEWGTRVELAVVSAGTPPTLLELGPAIGEALGRAAVPKRLHVLPALPLLPSGKLDRAALGGLPA
ncbi:O-succinylbenzoic acid--CoA ligase [Motilibacter peucedani]|uniref:O-succinylbenzoic acid--CoA ligase n=1 Tax=Motilibacter peucedani TaxID=598650 RepID=A0A420XL66_9ACTN|nr:o-succinylbenzoate--CoA ligase [Motilibacter peucedani]RKS69175.1 O-succinylbenzoic acid--CoA ligase [Motilibacter peucedani]